MVELYRIMNERKIYIKLYNELLRYDKEYLRFFDKFFDKTNIIVRNINCNNETGFYWETQNYYYIGDAV